MEPSVCVLAPPFLLLCTDCPFTACARGIVQEAHSLSPATRWVQYVCLLATTKGVSRSGGGGGEEEESAPRDSFSAIQPPVQVNPHHPLPGLATFLYVFTWRGYYNHYYIDTTATMSATFDIFLFSIAYAKPQRTVVTVTGESERIAKKKKNCKTDYCNICLFLFF